MAASSTELSFAQPNLTPLLDMVFQLITFFMLVINFKEASLDQSLKLPVLGSARPVESKGEDLLVLNIDAEGRLRVYGASQDVRSYIAAEARQEQARMKAKNKAFKPGDELATTVVIRADKATPFKLLNDVIKVCQKQNYRKFALKAVNRREARNMLRHRRVRAQSEVELNLASMLDMAFQLLAFFILTFHPSPIEGQLSLHLPPAVPLTNVASDKPEKAQAADAGASTAKTLDISAFANGQGDVSRVQLGLKVAFRGPADGANLRKLEKSLHEAFGLAGSPFEQIVIRVAPNLRYEELMKVIDVCTRQKMPDGQTLRKISFVEMSEAAPAK